MRRSEKALYSLLALPTANAFGHLLPAITAVWMVSKEQRYDLPFLTLLFSIHHLIDSVDKYKDMSPEGRSKAKWWNAYAVACLALIVLASSMCGLEVSVQLLRYLGLEVLWAFKVVPFYSDKQGFCLVKLKYAVSPSSQCVWSIAFELGSISTRFTDARVLNDLQLGPLKSLFCGFCLANMDCNLALLRICTIEPAQCPDLIVRRKAEAYCLLYSFIRETVYDARDVDEDSEEGLFTLPIAFGSRGTIAVFTAAAMLGEVAIIATVEPEVFVRAITTVVISAVMSHHPRSDDARWSIYNVCSLLPVSWAHMRLHL